MSDVGGVRDLDGSRVFVADALALYGSQPSYRATLDREEAKEPVDVAIVGDEVTVSAQLSDLDRIGVDEVAAHVPH